MRISDWSSDVCSSDLRERGPPSHDPKVSNKAYLGVKGKAPSAENWPGHSLVTGRYKLIEIAASNLLKCNGLASALTSAARGSVGIAGTLGPGRPEIGRASCGKAWLSTCKFGLSAYP